MLVKSPSYLPLFMVVVLLLAAALGVIGFQHLLNPAPPSVFESPAPQVPVIPDLSEVASAPVVVPPFLPAAKGDMDVVDAFPNAELQGSFASMGDGTVTMTLGAPAVEKLLPGARVRFGLFKDLAIEGWVVDVGGELKDYGMTPVCGFVSNGGGLFAFVASEEGLRGSIHQVGLPAIELTPAGEGRYELRSIADSDGFQCQAVGPEEPGKGGDPPPPPAPVVLDLLVCFTPAAEAAARGTTLLKLHAANAVSRAELVFQASKLPVSLRIVGFHPLAYVESGSLETDWKAIADPSDRVMDPVHPERDRVKADLVTLIVANGTDDGWGDILPASTKGDPWKAFSVLRFPAVTGSLVLCHEVGHNLGCEHEPRLARPNAAPASFAHGHVFLESGSRHQDVMGGWEPGKATTVPFFSDPNAYYGTSRLGIPNQSDCVRRIAETAPEVAKYR